MNRYIKHIWLKVCCLALVWVIALPVTGQQLLKYDPAGVSYLPIHATEATADDLFSSEEVLRFKLQLNYKALLKDRGDERSYHQATITYKTAQGENVAVPLKVRVRGRHRRDPNVCRFPPLLLNFPKKAVAKTWFAGTDKIKLVTHCIGDDYVLREYLVYKLYNIVADRSFRVRLCYIDYEDTENRKDIGGNYAFLIEEEERLADRSKSIIMAEELLIRMDATDERTMAKLAMFQFMIGNTDWSVPYRHNILLLYSVNNGKPVPVPYDFDYNGIVMPPYAKPPPILDIRSVRQRLFRGYTYTDDVLAELVPFFNNRREAFYQVYNNPLLDNKYKKQTFKYLDEFYEIINDPKDFRRYIVKQGERNEKNSIMIKGLEK